MKIRSGGVEEAPGPARARAAALLAAALLLLVLAAWRGIPPVVERVATRAIAREATRRGLAVRVLGARFRWLGPFSLRGLEVRRKDGTGLSASEVRFSWSLLGRGLLGRVTRVGITGLLVDLPAGASVRVADSDWGLRRLADGRLRLERGGTREALTLLAAAGGTGSENAREGPSSVRVDFSSLDLGAILRLERHGTPLPRPGRWTGTVTVTVASRGAGEGVLLSASGLLRVEGAQIPSLGEPGTGAPAWGAPFDAVVSVDANVYAGGPGEARFVEVPCWKVEAPAFSAHGSLVAVLSGEDAWWDVDVGEGRLDLAAALETSGIPRPAALAGVSELGIASLSWRVTGSVSRPTELVVRQALDFVPPPSATSALGRYNGPFTHEAPLPDGRSVPIVVAPGEPGFVPLEEVPPLLVRALLVSEDAGFWGHRGIDLAAVPVAAAMNLRDGGPLRGGSTISQQLAKNLFLSRERTYSRKLQELALTLLLEAALPKRRILEIYLNVIEWGPGLFGLRPAARRYFGKEPAELSPKEIAFLVALVPGPVKYQSSFAGGTLKPGFERLVNRILAMLRSVEALTEEEYEKAREESLNPGSGLTI